MIKSRGQQREMAAVPTAAALEKQNTPVAECSGLPRMASAGMSSLPAVAWASFSVLLRSGPPTNLKEGFFNPCPPNCSVIPGA